MEFNSKQEFVHYIQNGGRMEIPETVPSYIAELIKRCWDAAPHHRPSFFEVSPFLFYILFLFFISFISDC